MSTFSDLLPEASAILALATTAGMGLQWGALKALRDVRDDQSKEITLLKSQREEDKAEISKLKSDLSALSRVVTGEIHWKALGEQLDDHHAEAQKHWETQEGLLTELIDAIRIGEVKT